MDTALIQVTNLQTFVLLWMLPVLPTLVSSQSNYCTREIQLESFDKPIKNCENLQYEVVSSGKVVKTYPDDKACCPGYYGQECNIPKCSCTKGELCSDQRQCLCPSNNYRNEKCVTEVCNKAIDCFPGTCERSGGTMCTCASGFAPTNSSNMDCAALRYGPTLSSCRVIINGESYDTNCDSTSKQDVKLYARSLSSGVYNITNITVQFEMSYRPPEDTPPPNGAVSNSQIGITEVSISLITNNSKDTTEAVYPVPCSTHTLYTQQASFTCGLSANFTRPPVQHILRIYASAGGYRTIDDTTSITKNLNSQTTLFSTYIKLDTTSPDCPPNSNCRNIVVCPDITKEEFTVEWSEWQDLESGIASYEWAIFELIKNGNRLTQASLALLSGTWQPGQAYPKYLPEKSGMYAAVLNVTDNVGNFKAVRTWVLFDPNSKVVTTKSLPISLASAHKESRYEWISNAKKTLNYEWNNSFVTHMHEDFLLPIETKHPYLDIFHNLLQMGHNNSRGIINFNYSTSQIKPNIDDNRLWRPGGWIDVFLNESISIDIDQIDHADTFYFWIQATDIMGNSAMAKLVTRVDTTPPTTRSANTGETTLPPIVTAKLKLETNKPIDGIPHFTSSISSAVRDTDSGIGWAEVELHQGPNIIFKEIAPAVSYTTGCALEEMCYCLNTSGRCFPYPAEALINNCLFINRDTHNSVLIVKFKNQAGLPSNPINITIPEDLSTNSALDNYPPPVEVRAQNETSDTATLQWIYYAACYRRIELQITYSAKKVIRNITKNLTMMTSNFDEVTLSELLPNAKYVVTFVLIYEGNIESNSSTQFLFMTKNSPGLTGGAIAGIVIGILAFLTLVLLLIFLKDRWIPATTSLIQKAKLKSAPFPFPDSLELVSGKQINRPLPTLPRTGFGGFHSQRSSQASYNDVAIPGIRSVTPDQYDIFEELGRGKLAIVKSAILKDVSVHERATAKLNYPSATVDQKLLLRNKIEFLAKEVPSHQNVVNFVAADVSVPIIFLEECDQGPLQNFLKSFRSFNQQISDTLMNFNKDIIKALVHLHSLKIIHGRLGIRNIMLATSNSGRAVAKVTGFGPTEVGSEKKNKVPLRWMPPEYYNKESARLDTTQDEALDIWAYGITLWEMYSRGELPYRTMKGNGIKNFICSGQRLAKPDDCPELLYNQIISACWNDNPTLRPTATSIASDLENLFSSLDEDNIQNDVYDNA